MPRTQELSADNRLARQHSIDLLIMLAITSIMVQFFYGQRALLLLGIGLVSATACELLASLLFRSLRRPFDFHAPVVGICVAMLLPATAPYYLVFVGCAFAILVVKLPLGGTLHTPFVPAAAGFAFLCLCFPQELFRFPEWKTALTGAMSSADWGNGSSLAQMLQQGRAYPMGVTTSLAFLIGDVPNVPGPIGSSSPLVLLAVLALLLIRKPRAVLGPLGFLLSAAAFAFLFPRVAAGRMYSVLLELCAGSLLFAAVFFLPDPATSPEKGTMRLLYGVFAGILTMCLRRFGAFEEGVCFAVLGANAAWPLLEDALRKVAALFAVWRTKGLRLPLPRKQKAVSKEDAS